MNPTHYAILFTVAPWSPPGLTREQIRQTICIDYDVANLDRMLAQLCDSHWHHDGPLLLQGRDRYMVAGTHDAPGSSDTEPTQGWAVIEEARRNFTLPNREREWIDTARWPATERAHRLVNVAVPTGCTKHGYTGDPERQLFQRPPKVWKDGRPGERCCSRCRSLKIADEYSGNDRYCRLCRKILARERRKGKGNANPHTNPTRRPDRVRVL